jgi:hypothetical protein
MAETTKKLTTLTRLPLFLSHSSTVDCGAHLCDDLAQMLGYDVSHFVVCGHLRDHGRAKLSNA